jgi:hypothetical protein
VSRGELIEIGGAFRLPEIMAKSGAALKEVGTTNRTHPDDCERAIDRNTGLLLKVHTSNYRIVGFSTDVFLSTLVEIGRRHHVPVMEDLGSGALIDRSEHGVPKEPLVSERVAMGADLVMFSGDKVLGGPQAGLLVGRTPVIARASRKTRFTAPCGAASSPSRRSRRRCGSIWNRPMSLARFPRWLRSRGHYRTLRRWHAWCCPCSRGRSATTITLRSRTRRRRLEAERCRPRRSRPR